VRVEYRGDRVLSEKMGEGLFLVRGGRGPSVRSPGGSPRASLTIDQCVCLLTFPNLMNDVTSIVGVVRYVVVRD
jgi:hypothetical protein